MSKISDMMKERYQNRISGALESCSHEIEGETVKIYWKPLTGMQNKTIQQAGKKSVSEGMCQHVKIRALDKDGELIFKDIALIGMMHDFDFEKDISTLFFKMTGVEFDIDDIEKN